MRRDVDNHFKRMTAEAAEPERTDAAVEAIAAATAPLIDDFELAGRAARAALAVAGFMTETSHKIAGKRCDIGAMTPNPQKPKGAVSMADETTPSVIPLHQVPPKKAKTGAERTKTYRQRKRQKAKADSSADSSESLIPPEFLSADSATAEPSDPRLPAATPHLAEPVMPSRHQLVPVVLSTAALALGAVGVTINGWFARSLGSSDLAGWLFFAVGVAADLVALVLPSRAAGLWQVGQRATALVGWAVWLMTFVFAVSAGIGFASTNIADVAMVRASRVTPAVAVAQAALADAMAARDRECKGGVGKFCREREAAVAERRQALDAAMHGVEQIADPQSEAAIRIVAWLSVGMLHPTAEDFAMLRLVLLALLPQIGGILLMVARRPADMPR